MLKELVLSRFTPSLLTQDALEAIFVQREALAERLVQSIRDSALTANKHYALLVGQRGIGKTHMVSLVYHRVKDDAEAMARLKIAWLREEEWGIASYLDLLRSILRALGEEHEDTELGRANEGLSKLTMPEAELEAERLLLGAVGDRTLLLIGENMDEIFSGLEKEGQQKLRAFIQNNPVFTLLATTRGLFGGVTVRDSPFYGFFDIHHLPEFSVDDATRLLGKIAEQEKNDELASLLNTPQGHARIRAVHYLAGGNPRVYIIFSQFLTRDSLDKLVAPVLQTLDDLTAYYQERIARLTPQQRKIIQFLCDRRGAISVKAIAEENFITHQTASSQLKKLSDLGYVRSEQRGRESYYELREPLMRISLSVKKYHGEYVGLLVDFLRVWYSHADLNRLLAELKPEATVERTYLSMAIRAKEEEPEDPVAAACLKSYSVHIGRNDFEGALQALDDLTEVRESFQDWVWRAECLRKLGRETDAADSEARALAPSAKDVEINPESASNWKYHGLCLGSLDRHQEALAAFDRALDIKPDDADILQNRALCLILLDRYEVALAAFDKALELNPEDALSWNGRGSCLAELRRHEEALAAHDKALEIDPEDAFSWSSRGYCLGVLRRHEDALAACDKALEINPENASAWSNRGASLAELRRHEEALAAYDRVLEIDPENAQAWCDRGICLADLHRHEDALAAYEKALEIDPENDQAWYGRGVRQTILHRYEEAVTAYDRALEIDPENAQAWCNRGLCLAELHRYREALATFDKALEINPELARVSNNRGACLRDLGRHKEALDAIDRALELEQSSFLAWSNLGDVLSVLGRHEQALAAFDRSLELDSDDLVFHRLSNRAVIMMLLGDWNDGRTALDDATARLAEGDTSDPYEVVAIVRNMLARTRDTVTWRKHIGVWLEVFSAHGVRSSLGQGLVRSIQTLGIPQIDKGGGRAWYEVWQELAGGYKEMALPLRLLGTAVEYREKQDDRVLFQLPLEERKLIEPLLGIHQGAGEGA